MGWLGSSGIWWVGGGIGLALGIVIAALVMRARRSGGNAAIVLLGPKARRLSDAQIRAAARRAIDPEVNVVAMNAATEKPELRGACAVLMDGAPRLFVYSVDKPYVEDPAAESVRFEDPTARRAFAEHRAWIAIDVVGSPRGAALRAAQGLACRLAAELLEDDITLIYSTTLHRIAVPGETTAATLRSENPLEIFGDDGVNTPVIDATDDPRVERAVMQARERWPEFLAIHQRVGAAGDPLVKAAFATSDDGHEHMWLRVISADAGGATGELIDEPVHVKTVSKGQTVTITVEEISDWAIMENDKPVGLFVERLIRG